MDGLTWKEAQMEEWLRLYPNRYWRGMSLEEMMFPHVQNGKSWEDRLVFWADIGRALDGLTFQEKTFISFTYWLEADWRDTCKVCKIREGQWGKFRKKILGKLIAFLGL